MKDWSGHYKENASGEAERTMRFVNLNGPGLLGSRVLELVFLRRVPEDCIVDGRNFKILSYSSAQRGSKKLVERARAELPPRKKAHT